MSSSDSESVEQVVEEGIEEDDDEEFDQASGDAESDNSPTDDNDDAVGEEEESESEISESEDESDSDREFKKKNSINSTSTIKVSAKKTTSISEKFEQLKGKQLFVLFPARLPTDPTEFETKVKGLHSLIVKAIKPRQKHARHCIIQFESQDDRAVARKDLTKMDVDGKKLIIKLPKMEDEEFVKTIIAKQTAKTLKNREKFKLKRLARVQAKKSQTFTSTLNLSNIPSSATAADVRKLFPEAVDFRFTCAKGAENTSTASVTLATPRDASVAYKKKLSVNGNELKKNFAVTKTPEQLKKLKLKNKQKKDLKKNSLINSDAVKTEPKAGNKRKSDQEEANKEPMKKPKKNNTVPIKKEKASPVKIKKEAAPVVDKKPTVEQGTFGKKPMHLKKIISSPSSKNLKQVPNVKSNNQKKLLNNKLPQQNGNKKVIKKETEKVFQKKTLNKKMLVK